MDTYDTWEMFLEDQHDRREFDNWLTEVEYEPTPLPEPPPTPKSLTCPDCHKRLETYQITVRGKMVTEGTCWTAGCTLHSTTRSLSFWTADDETERDIYRAMNRKAVAS